MTWTRTPHLTWSSYLHFDKVIWHVYREVLLQVFRHHHFMRIYTWYMCVYVQFYTHICSSLHVRLPLNISRQELHARHSEQNWNWRSANNCLVPAFVRTDISHCDRNWYKSLWSFVIHTKCSCLQKLTKHALQITTSKQSYSLFLQPTQSNHISKSSPRARPLLLP